MVSVRERMIAVVLLAILPIIAAAVYVAGRRSDPDLLPPVLTTPAGGQMSRTVPSAVNALVPALTSPAPATSDPAPSSRTPPAVTVSPGAVAPAAAAASTAAVAPPAAGGLSLDATVATFVGALPQPGWTVDATPAAFGASRLYEKIDGRADLYLRHGVRRLVSASLASGDHFIDVFAYDLGIPLAADGLWRDERPADAGDVTIGRHGYAAGGSVFFTVDCYYVQLVAADTAAETQAAAMAFGRGLASLLGGAPCR